MRSTRWKPRQRRSRLCSKIVMPTPGQIPDTQLNKAIARAEQARAALAHRPRRPSPRARYERRRSAARQPIPRRGRLGLEARESFADDGELTGRPGEICGILPVWGSLGRGRHRTPALQLPVRSRTLPPPGPFAPQATPRERAFAAVAAAPYCHVRRSAVTIISAPAEIPTEQLTWQSRRRSSTTRLSRNMTARWRSKARSAWSRMRRACPGRASKPSIRPCARPPRTGSSAWPSIARG
jgi:hypothetical protein